MPEGIEPAAGVSSTQPVNDRPNAADGSSGKKPLPQVARSADGGGLKAQLQSVNLKRRPQPKKPPQDEETGPITVGAVLMKVVRRITQSESRDNTVNSTII